MPSVQRARAELRIASGDSRIGLDERVPFGSVRTWRTRVEILAFQSAIGTQINVSKHDESS